MAKLSKTAARKVAGLDADFRADPPDGAATGLYGPTARDRWAGKNWRVPDGVYQLKKGEWFYRFADGAFAGAVHVSRAGFQPETFTTVDGA